MRNEPAKEIIINKNDIDTFIKVLNWTKEAMFYRYGNPIYYKRYEEYMTACNKMLEDFNERLEDISNNTNKDTNKNTNDFLEQERRRIEGHYESKSDIIDANDK